MIMWRDHVTWLCDVIMWCDYVVIGLKFNVQRLELVLQLVDDTRPSQSIHCAGDKGRKGQRNDASRLFSHFHYQLTGDRWDYDQCRMRDRQSSQLGSDPFNQSAWEWPRRSISDKLVSIVDHHSSTSSFSPASQESTLASTNGSLSPSFDRVFILLFYRSTISYGWWRYVWWSRRAIDVTIPAWCLESLIRIGSAELRWWLLLRWHALIVVGMPDPP